MRGGYGTVASPLSTLVATISDEVKFWTHFLVIFTLKSIGSRVDKGVTLGTKLFPCACKFEICYHATKSCYCFA